MTGSSDPSELPDFSEDQWRRLFKETQFLYEFDEDDELAEASVPPPLTLRKQDVVSRAMDNSCWMYRRAAEDTGRPIWS